VKRELDGCEGDYTSTKDEFRSVERTGGGSTGVTVHEEDKRGVREEDGERRRGFIVEVWSSRLYLRFIKTNSLKHQTQLRWPKKALDHFLRQFMAESIESPCRWKTKFGELSTTEPVRPPLPHCADGKRERNIEDDTTHSIDSLPEL